MAFFQELGKKITNATQDAAKKTSDLIEISKLNSGISTEKAAITELQKKIGVTVYSLYTAGEPIPDILAPDVRSITTHLKNISGLENKIAEIKAAAEKARSDAAEAAHTPPPPPAEEAQAEKASPSEQPDAAARFCTGCGAPLGEGMLFCSKCGTKNE